MPSQQVSSSSATQNSGGLWTNPNGAASGDANAYASLSGTNLQTAITNGAASQPGGGATQVS